MRKLVFVSGDFSSGSSLLFTLFRKTEEYYCLYEPLHERLPEYLIWPLSVYEHHFFVENYFAEYKGFERVPELFDPGWGSSNLHLAAEDEAEDLYRYVSYLIEAASAHSEKVVLKFNRATFRLGWMRRRFPEATILHIYRPKEKQWNSIVRRAQAHLGREDVGQDRVDFNGMNIARWCEDLKRVFPELQAVSSESGFERFGKLYDLSFREHKKYSELSVNFEELTTDFERVCREIWDCVGCSVDPSRLKQFVVHPDAQRPLVGRRHGWRARLHDVVDRIGVKQARVRLRLRKLLDR